MRRPGADLEEKPEPRVALLAEAQNGDGMKQSGRGLTRAAIEKPTFSGPKIDRTLLLNGGSPAAHSIAGSILSRQGSKTNSSSRVRDAVWLHRHGAVQIPQNRGSSTTNQSNLADDALRACTGS